MGRLLLHSRVSLVLLRKKQQGLAGKLVQIFSMIQITLVKAESFTMAKLSLENMALQMQ